MWDENLGTITTGKHQVKLVDPITPPVHSASYLARLKARELEKMEITEMLEDSINQRVQTEWAFSIDFAPIKDCALQICVDLHRPNALTKRYLYATAQTSESIDSLGAAAMFSTLNSNSGYRKIEIDEPDQDKTAFTSHQGLYCFKRMSSGLQNTLGPLQKDIHHSIYSEIALCTCLSGWYYSALELTGRTRLLHATHAQPPRRC